MKNGRIVIGIDIQPRSMTPQLKCFDFSTLSIQPLDTAGAVTKEQISKYTPSSDAHKIYTMLYKIKVPSKGHQVYVYYISDTQGHLKYETVDALVSLRQAGHLFSNFSIRNRQIVYGIKHEIQELTVQDLLQDVYGTGSSIQEFALDLKRIPKEITDLTFTAPDAPQKPNLTVGSTPSNVTVRKLAFKGNWGSLHLGVVQDVSGERTLEIDNVERLIGATAFRNIKINSVKKISHCFNSEYIGDNKYTFQINNPAIQEIEFSFDGIKGTGLPIEAILSNVEVLINSFNGFGYIPSNIIFSSQARKISNSLDSNTLDKRPLSLTATSSSTSIEMDKNTQIIEGATLSIPILSETNILNIGECTLIYQEPKTPEESRLKK